MFKTFTTIGRYSLGSAIVSLLLVFAACGGAGYEPLEEYVTAIETPEETQPYITEEAENPGQAAEQTEFTEPEGSPPAHYFDALSSGRLRIEYLEDFDYLYNTLVANFPFFGVIYRSQGVDLHQLYYAARRNIETIPDISNDHQFAAILDSSFIGPAHSAGHFNMLANDFLRLHIGVFANQVATGSDQFLYFLYELDNPATRALHRLEDEDYLPPPPGEASVVFATSSNNIEASIIQPGHIAYINILQMNWATAHLDREKLLNFYQYIADFDHLIIDIRQNGGGDSRFFPQLVVAPNIRESLEYYFYMFLMDGEHNHRLLAPWFENWWDGTTPYPVFMPVHDDLLARLIYLDADDALLLDSYWIQREAIHPSHDEAIFGGKIWLLVSNNNFSASENAAAISRQTGFATLVGQTTGGDGIGINPLVLALPNTGVVVRYSPVYGTDPLGRNNQEFGTDPHVFNRPGLDALQTVLELIAEGDY